MRVIHYVHSFGGYSGATKQAISLSIELDKMGCKQIFISESVGRERKKNESNECIFLNGTILGIIKFIYQLIIFRPDLVHFHGASFKYLLFSSIFSKVYWKTTLNGDDDFDSLIHNSTGLKSIIKRKLLSLIDLNNSLTFQNYIINSKYLAKEKIVTIPNGVFFSDNINYEKEKVILVIATIIPRKRVLESISFYKKNFENKGYKLYIIGPYNDSFLDGYNSDYARVCLSYKSGNIIFTGKLESCQVQAYLQKASHLILFSLQEGMPNVVLEALSFGVIPIVTSMGGVSEEMLSPPLVGIIIEDKDLHNVFELPESNLLTFNNCRNHIYKNFSIEKIAIRTYEAYSKVVLRDES
ncbi:glycosyltransferase family 4 protein [Shewanella sp. SP2S2-4]|uniref:glycosyltransferase family 4 protein n=1 Tax=Shewanella sp. SP2S2-4 TaxID=3063539 RepID=UPI002890D1BD|nr:glycosyltransferase family 4 protein [Shewanella sp. SP2S2-4]MDT3275662.1 glycosyltransferase family 4 protein [Shewanella sp. SP2S2-4]